MPWRIAPEKIVPEAARELAALFGSALRTLVVYGSAAGSGFRPEHSDVNLAAVVEPLEFAQLQRVAQWWARWRRHRVAAPLLLSVDAPVSAAHVQRVLSAEEREWLGPDAWGYLLDLRRSGTLDAGQFERVVELLAGSGMHPVSLAMAREAAASIVLQLDPEASGEIPNADLDVAH